MSYQKRARAHGCWGKSYKDQKNRQERQYGKQEVEQAQQELLEGESFRYKHKSKKTLTPLQKAEKELNWYKKRLEYWDRPNIANSTYLKGDSFFTRMINGYRSKVEKLTKERDEQLKLQESGEDK